MSDAKESRYAALARRVVEAHAAQLLHDVQRINERTLRELGPLPRGGLPVQVKRKPKPAPWAQPVQHSTPPHADAPPGPHLATAEREDLAMSKPTTSSIENGLPAPPVPQKLRKLLKDYPELIERLQQQLNFAVRRPSKVTPPFEWVIWMLEDEIDSFVVETREELDLAKIEGDSQRIERARNKDFAVGYARFNMGAMSELRSYLEGEESR
ncbi:hypothetical protein [Xanthomonas cucurbitae]|uniref:Uncharacterized protein n=1 Tax=Xanthomonas cucurbitae TaxID=56453 RepID=A0ABY7YA11_9XANT|nr:hypothetical protein [Xanthomonas cucurbitae]WDM66822.1 hypothetical protein K6981_15105 [Xanthomonas cucurbitae]WDM70699.1 hypothetical protein K6978_15075 [Xanthomonas cucurbitae]